MEMVQIGFLWNDGLGNELAFVEIMNFLYKEWARFVHYNSNKQLMKIQLEFFSILYYIYFYIFSFS